MNITSYDFILHHIKPDGRHFDSSQPGHLCNPYKTEYPWHMTKNDNSVIHVKG